MPASEYVLHRKLTSLDSFDVTDAAGAHAFGVKYHIDGLTKASWTLTDASGAPVGKLIRAGVHMHPTFTLDRPGHDEVTISKSNFMPVQETWRAGEIHPRAIGGVRQAPMAGCAHERRIDR